MNKIDFGFMAEDFCLDGDFPIEIYEKPTQETILPPINNDVILR